MANFIKQSSYIYIMIKLMYVILYTDAKMSSKMNQIPK